MIRQLWRGLEVHPEQILAPRRLVGHLAREVQAAATREVSGGKDVQRGETRSIQAVRRNPAEHAAVLETAGRVARTAWQPGGEVANVRERIAAAVDALGEVPLALERRRNGRLVERGRIRAPLKLLAPEEEQLRLVFIEPREGHWPANRVAGVVARRVGLRDGGRVPVVQPRVRVPTRPASIPIAGAVEALRAALGDNLHLAADGPPVFRLVRVREDLELGDGIDVRRHHVATVVAGVDVGHAVNRDVVGFGSLTVHGETVDRPELGAGRVPGQDARHERREVEQHASIAGDVLERLALERERALTAVRLQLDGARRDADFLGHVADFQRERSGRELVVGVHHHVRALECLEALERDLERVGIGTDDGEHETSALVGNRGEYVALRAARQRDGDARQNPALRILYRSRNRSARRLRSKDRGMSSDHGGHKGKTHESLETS